MRGLDEAVRVETVRGGQGLELVVKLGAAHAQAGTLKLGRTAREDRSDRYTGESRVTVP